MAPSLSFSQLKAKVAERAGEAGTPRNAPYKSPVSPPGATTSSSVATSRQQFEQSTVLQQQAARNYRPPPPLRNRSTGGTPVQSNVNHTAAAAAAPRPPPPMRKSAHLSVDAGAHASASITTSRSNLEANSSFSKVATTSSPRPTPPPPSYVTPFMNTFSPPPLPGASPVPQKNHAARSGQNSAFTRFSDFSAADKEQFFSLLDEFFETKLTAKNENFAPAADEPPAPPIALLTLPSVVPMNSPSSALARASYPPPETHSSAALSFLYYILHTPYSSNWFTETSPVPPPLQTRSDIQWTASFQQNGSEKTLFGFVLFGDASVAWYKLQWDQKEESSGNRIEPQRQAKYRPRPEAWSAQELYEASENYGPLIVKFAQEAAASRLAVARGECWDLANSALESIQSNAPNLPQPFPSIGRTHGHLIFYARAGGQGKGNWRGGDVYVRAGDIVEWNSVTICEVGAVRGSYSTLGDPEHTAIIVDTGAPTSLPDGDGAVYPITALYSLTVIEQSQGFAPTEKIYDMTKMSAGEIWIYRPVSLEAYCGSLIQAVWPPPCESFEMGQLE